MSFNLSHSVAARLMVYIRINTQTMETAQK